MGRPITFDEIRAMELYHLSKTDVEIAKILGVPQSTIDSWRQRRELPTNVLDVKIKYDIPQYKRKSYRDCLTPSQAVEIERFLRALCIGDRECKQAGVKPDIGAAMYAWGNVPRTKEENAITIGFMARERQAREKDKLKIKGVS